MKAERRHELQTNALAKFLSELPLYFRFHLGKVLLVVFLAAAVFLLVRHRMTAVRERPIQTVNRLAEARRLTQQLQQVDFAVPDVRQRADQRRQIASQAEGLLDEVMQTTSDPGDAAVRAEALVTLGDLYWIQANLPELPGATTQPLLAMPRAAEEYLQRAEQTYQRVLREYPDRRISAVTARFGLAAIAENRGDWDAARAQYDAVLAAADLPPTMHGLARQRIDYLQRYRDPLFTGTIESPYPPATAPATAPADEIESPGFEAPMPLRIEPPAPDAPPADEPRAVEPAPQAAPGDVPPATQPGEQP